MRESRPVKLTTGAGMTVGPGEEGPADLKLNERVYIYIMIRQLGQLTCLHHGMIMIMIMKRLLWYDMIKIMKNIMICQATAAVR